jgi:hypothetical protein
VVDGRHRGATMRRGVSEAMTEAAAALELAGQIIEPGTATVLVFASPRFDAPVLAAALAEAFPGVSVYGCTTAGEIGPGGFHDGSLVGLGLCADEARVGASVVCEISRSALSSGRRATLEAIENLGISADRLRPKRHVAITLIDGRSGQEEGFIAGAAATVPAIRFVGGSASDDLNVAPRARVFCGGKAHADCGLVLLLEVSVPFAVVVAEHVVPTEERVVVTSADPSARLVHELNGKPAREVYARLIGREGDVDTALAAPFPFGYYVGGRPYVRSIMEVVGDSLRFACVVDNGAVLRLMRAGDMLASTRQTLDDAAAEVGGQLDAVLAFSCLARYLECESKGMRAQMSELLDSYPIVGFNTFGEQINALHVNHTLTGLALAQTPRRGG